MWGAKQNDAQAIIYRFNLEGGRSARFGQMPAVALQSPAYANSG
jgi:hypothetical protein